MMMMMILVTVASTIGRLAAFVFAAFRPPFLGVAACLATTVAAPVRVLVVCFGVEDEPFSGAVGVPVWKNEEILIKRIGNTAERMSE
jgi:hypothetical protein